MFNLRNLTAGSFLQVIPLGLLCNLNYNNKGILQNVSLLDGSYLDSPLTIMLEKEEILKQRIPLNGSDCKVFGILYTGTRFDDEGVLPECIESSIIKDIKKHFDSYHFYAIDIESELLKMSGMIVRQNKLSTLGFSIITGYSITNDFDNNKLENLLRVGKYPFTYPVISGYYITNIKGESKFYPLNYENHVVKKITQKVDENGYILADVDCKDKKYTLSYTDIVKFNLYKNMLVVFDGNKIIHSYNDSKTRVPSIIKCSVCGKQVQVPINGFVTCSDPHCRSTIFHEINHMLAVLGYDALSFETFSEYIKANKITTITDALDLDEYKDKKVRVSLSKAIRSIVPINVCSSNDYISDFVTSANSVEGLTYYINNPESIAKDMKLNEIETSKFQQWLWDKYNVASIETILNHPNVVISEDVKRFEGVPIFRNKTICITGKFLHGDLETIVAILRSYSANVITQFDKSASCVVVGHFRQENNEIITLARGYNIPIYREDDFFKSYEIDEDLNK